jgi:predicted aldo/keto reductase-like oxidoreductase
MPKNSKSNRDFTNHGGFLPSEYLLKTLTKGPFIDEHEEISRAISQAGLARIRLDYKDFLALKELSNFKTWQKGKYIIIQGLAEDASSEPESANLGTVAHSDVVPEEEEADQTEGDL